VAALKRQNSPEENARHAIYAEEATGLLLIAFLLFVLIPIRYWHGIHWGLR
jgi:hypothetical protein